MKKCAAYYDFIHIQMTKCKVRSKRKMIHLRLLRHEASKKFPSTCKRVVHNIRTKKSLTKYDRSNNPLDRKTVSINFYFEEERKRASAGAFNHLEDVVLKKVVCGREASTINGIPIHKYFGKNTIDSLLLYNKNSSFLNCSSRFSIQSTSGSTISLRKISTSVNLYKRKSHCKGKGPPINPLIQEYKRNKNKDTEPLSKSCFVRRKKPPAWVQWVNFLKDFYYKDIKCRCNSVCEETKKDDIRRTSVSSSDSKLLGNIRSIRSKLFQKSETKSLGRTKSKSTCSPTKSHGRKIPVCVSEKVSKACQTPCMKSNSACDILNGEDESPCEKTNKLCHPRNKNKSSEKVACADPDDELLTCKNIQKKLKKDCPDLYQSAKDIEVEICAHLADLEKNQKMKDGNGKQKRKKQDDSLEVEEEEKRIRLEYEELTRTEEAEKKRSEEERKRKEEEEKNRCEEERKKKEEEERKHEGECKKKEEEEKKPSEEERKRRECEERKRKVEEDKKRCEERMKKSAEEQRRKRTEEERKRRDCLERMRQEEERRKCCCEEERKRRECEERKRIDYEERIKKDRKRIFEDERKRKGWEEDRLKKECKERLRKTQEAEKRQQLIEAHKKKLECNERLRRACEEIEKRRLCEELLRMKKCADRMKKESERQVPKADCQQNDKSASSVDVKPPESSYKCNKSRKTWFSHYNESELLTCKNLKEKNVKEKCLEDLVHVDVPHIETTSTGKKLLQYSYEKPKESKSCTTNDTIQSENSLNFKIPSTKQIAENLSDTRSSTTSKSLSDSKVALRHVKVSKCEVGKNSAGNVVLKIRLKIPVSAFEK